MHDDVNKLYQHRDVVEVVAPTSVFDVLPRVTLLPHHHILIQIFEEAPETVDIAGWRGSRTPVAPAWFRLGWLPHAHRNRKDSRCRRIVASTETPSAL